MNLLGGPCRYKIYNMKTLQFDTVARPSRNISKTRYEERKKGEGLKWKSSCLFTLYRHMCKHKNKKMYKLYNLFSLVHFPFVCFRLAYFITFLYIFFYLKGGIPHPPGSANAYTCISLCICFSLTLSLFPPNSCL